MRRVVAKALIEVDALVGLGGIEKINKDFKNWMTNCNMHGMSVKILIEPDFKEIENEQI